MPLYSISPADLGIEASSVKTLLKESLERAEKWNAIVLLNDAEVFLEKRDVNYLARSQLVSG
jgi:hypothetical protein